jgi:hypothetical protein
MFKQGHHTMHQGSPSELKVFGRFHLPNTTFNASTRRQRAKGLFISILTTMDQLYCKSHALHWTIDGHMHVFKRLQMTNVNLIGTRRRNTRHNMKIGPCWNWYTLVEDRTVFFILSFYLGSINCWLTKIV